MTIKIFTASWRTKLDDVSHCRVGISRSNPRNLKGYRTYPRLFPGDWWRSIDDPIVWAKRYQTDVLAPLDPNRVLEDLAELAGDAERAIALCCWETREPWSGWCHRALVSIWFEEQLGLEVSEFGDHQCNCGWRHPMLSPLLRRGV